MAKPKTEIKQFSFWSIKTGIGAFVCAGHRGIDGTAF